LVSVLASMAVAFDRSEVHDLPPRSRPLRCPSR
jgi:hypothetical protein